ncbi:MAG: peptide chain release factor N(5)-glutamine methyltransferase [Clostridiales bacterium]|nr:peptide chain release factor N(5)-glutamine methyltransferase [Clostridiales bacterium]
MSLSRSSVKDLLREITGLFKENNIDEAKIDASLILMRQLGFTKTQLYSRDGYVPDENQMRKIDYWVLKRLEGRPVQYLLGKTEFMGLSIKVSDFVLIPRPDTEILVEEVLKISSERGYKTGLDIGTGSGAIALSLAYYNKTLEMTACDISEKALIIARQNIKDYGVKVRLVKSNLFENIEGKFDFIVSNPPYIRTGIIPTLDKKVKNYEPLKALDGGEDGLNFYRNITASSLTYLNKNGMLAYETGYDQGEAVSNILKENGFKNIEIKKDLAGLDRVVIGFK